MSAIVFTLNERSDNRGMEIVEICAHRECENANNTSIVFFFFFFCKLYKLSLYVVVSFHSYALNIQHSRRLGVWIWKGNCHLCKWLARRRLPIWRAPVLILIGKQRIRYRGYCSLRVIFLLEWFRLQIDFSFAFMRRNKTEAEETRFQIST